MTFITGSLTSANPAADLYAQQIAPALTTAGFTLVDTVVISTRTHAVWKSAAASNSHNLDWYLDVAYVTTGTGGVYLSAFEYYDPATHLGYRGPYSISSTSAIETTYYSRYGATGYALETNWYTINSAHLLSLATTAFTYWISITTDRVVGMTSVAATTVVYAGFYTPDSDYATAAGNLMYPLVSGYLPVPGINAYNYMQVTRIPLVTSIYDWQHVPWVSTPDILSPIGPIADVAGVTSSPVPGPARGAQFFLGAGSSNAYPSVSVAPFTAVRFGTIPDCLWFLASAGVIRGDTITIDGQQWVLTTYLGSTNYTAIAFKAA